MRVVGGTGDFGLALARRLAEAGKEVVIGSRDAGRAAAKVVEAGAAAGAIGATPVPSVASELRFTTQGVFPPDDPRSIAERTQALPRGSVAAGPARGDALVCGGDADAKAPAPELAAKVVSGRALDAGPLASARALEGLTAVIVNLNERYKGRAGVSVTGLP